MNKIFNVERYKNTFIVLGILACLIYMSISIWLMNWDAVFSVIKNVEVFPWLFIAIAFYGIGIFLRGMRLKKLISPDSQLSILTASNVVITGYAVNYIIPARVGELARASILSERSGVPFLHAGMIVCIERIFDAVVLLLFTALIIPAIITPEIFKEALVSMCILLFVAVAIISMFVLAPNRLLARISKITHRFRFQYHALILKIFISILNGTVYLRRFSNVCTILLFSIIIWSCDAALFYFVFYAFQLEMNIFYAAGIMAIVNIGVFFIPFTPGYASPGHIGIFHLMCIQTMLLLGFAKGIATQYAIIAHFAFFLPIVLWGGLVFLWYGLKLRKAYSLSKKATDLSSSPEQVCAAANRIGALSSETTVETSPSAFIISMVQAAVPVFDEQELDQKEYIFNTAKFVHQEINNLPKKLRMLLVIGLCGFRFLVFLRYFKDFSQLSLDVRKRVFDAWAYGRLASARKLMKMIRCTSLLGFYEYRTVEPFFKNK